MVDLKNKRVLIVGLGESGLAALEAILTMGARASVYDIKTQNNVGAELLYYLNENNVESFFGETPRGDDRFDLLILSPGIPPDLEFIKIASLAGSEIIGELEFAFRYSKGVFAAITGTNGKTTTTDLLGKIFKSAGRDTLVVGNIGTAAARAIAKAEEGSWLITEVSSYQLETIKDFRPRYSAILNLAPDHLDRHKDMRGYIEAKANIFKNQNSDDFFIVNYDDKETYKLAGSCKAKIAPFSRVSELEYGAFVKNGKIVIRGDCDETEFCGADELLIPGKHNLENALAAVAVAYFAGIPADAITNTLKSYRGIAHRLELCGEKDGVRFINDSKGTNPDASIKAIESIAGPVILIAGGYDKKADFGELIAAFGNKVKFMVLLGATAGKIKEAAEKAGFTNSVIMGDMEKCVDKAYELARPGDTILLSPACASWGMYKNFEERGERFKERVLGLVK